MLVAFNLKGLDFVQKSEFVWNGYLSRGTLQCTAGEMLTPILMFITSSLVSFIIILITSVILIFIFIIIFIVALMDEEGKKKVGLNL